MDDDNPPPKKKSRFFSNGKSKIGNIIPSFRKQSHQRQSSGSGNPSTSESSSTSGLSALRNPFSSRPEHPPPSNLNNSAASSADQPSDTAQNTLGIGNEHLSQPNGFGGGSHVPFIRGHPAGTGHLRSDEHDGQDQDSRDNHDEDTGLDDIPTAEKTSKDERRKAIYGIEALGPQATQIIPRPVTYAQTGAQHDPDNQGSDSAPGVRSDEPLQAPYTFTGTAATTSTTSSLPQTTSSHGLSQEPFTFRMGIPQQTPNQPSVRDGEATEQHETNATRIATPQTQTTQVTANTQRSNVIPSHRLLTPLPPGATHPYVDMDRDEEGRPLSRSRYQTPLSHALYANSTGLPTHRIPNLGANIQSGMAHVESLVPDHLLTSPGRIHRAKMHAHISLKRKRPDTVLPPQPYVYSRDDHLNFNVFDGILLYPELVFALATALPVKDLISLYAISKDFHTIINTRFTTVVLSQALQKAPESARAFPFRSYAKLCRTDPAARIPHPNAALAARSIPRSIPSFRWLKMLLHREKVIHELVTVFAEDGIPLPFRCRLALKRLWYMLDLPDNARRIGYVHNKRLMTDLDIYFSACFFVKLDMRLNDPVASEKRDGMRKLLLSQKSFTTILQVMKCELWTTKFEVLKEWIKLRYEPMEDEVGLPMFGVRPEKIGKGRLEYWGEKSTEQLGRTPGWLFRPDQLIVREAIRRDTLQDYAPRKYGRRIEQLKNDEYEIDDMIGGVSALAVGDEGFDDLLDLGQPRRGSPYTIVKEKTSKQEKVLRKKQEEFLGMCIAWWEREMKSADGNESWSFRTRVLERGEEKSAGGEDG
ncbi:hypothetical protein LTR10_019243 [Elasticomyces elasticus]|uniref:F-box domain-containing protein n=1 Tax=Exophiala sideris TaxID=1016849 RepID=A0ABR0JQ55_9EURO|nr:hypothetical protein LTR10_019243 [Elasticomyces elasticus]KAK5038077.1 hypothetical protein LTS07_001545 [Exophiala sideris]KAK5044059.1 hypothetical protein LTR13_000415 [Exophiala sideris]KAK5067559.1 hypothetical protein LTR69_001548 [Exophiala sideris]KAK5184202.1 hypothetical protein LTR44_003708 [Eurotiomycetes sp. CCFEE 6388]